MRLFLNIWNNARFFIKITGLSPLRNHILGQFFSELRRSMIFNRVLGPSPYIGYPMFCKAAITGVVNLREGHPSHKAEEQFNHLKRFRMLRS